MKVPTYKSQLQRTDRTGAGMLTAQLDPNVMMLPGKGLQNFGTQIANFGADLLEVETKKKQLATKNESSQAVQYLNAELKGIRLEADKIQNPHEAEAYWLENSQTAFNNVINSLSKDAKTLFSIDGQKIYTDINYDFFKVNNPKIPEHTKKVAAGETEILLDKVSNVNNSLQSRMNDMRAVLGGNVKNTSNFKFSTPSNNNVGFARGGNFTEKDDNLLNYHRLSISNNTYLENKDGSITTIYIKGIKNPAEGKNSPIYAVPGYYDGSKDWTEEEVIEKAVEEDWFNVYPSDTNEAAHKRRVNKLKKHIDKDGKSLSKIEETFKTGLNFELYKENIVNYNEFTDLNKQALSTISTDILKYLMNAADDADDVIEDVMDDNIKDPIFNMIWENLPIEEKDKILRSSMDIAKDIEGFKDKVEKEKNEQYDEELKNSRQILFNSTDYEEALERHNFILSINGYESDAQRTSAEKRIESLKNIDESVLRFRKTTEGSDPTTIKDLEQADLDDDLEYGMVMDVASLLTETKFQEFLGRVKTERNEGLDYGLKQFKTIYGYTEDMDSEKRLGQIVEAAYNKSAGSLREYVNNNKNATYDEIVQKHIDLLNENDQIFKTSLKTQRTKDVLQLSNNYPLLGDITTMTNKEIMEKAKEAFIDPAINFNDIEYEIVIEAIGYYELQEVDK